MRLSGIALSAALALGLLLGAACFRRFGACGDRCEFVQRDDLGLLVDRSLGIIGVLQLLLAETDRENALGRNLEGLHQRIPDRFGPALAEQQIIVAPALASTWPTTRKT